VAVFTGIVPAHAVIGKCAVLAAHGERELVWSDRVPDRRPDFWAPYGVHVNAIAPGIFPDVVTAGEERVRQTTQRAKPTVPLRRPGKLREVGFLALYLASAASDYITGQTILLDGGMSL
jgi:NAD(P)-dependent dehydrogenase (short-subunit alcohol dehydrogenase family)